MNTTFVKALQEGKIVKFRPVGNSMVPRIKSGQLVTVWPFPPTPIFERSIVFCKVKGKLMVHQVKKIGEDGRYLIANQAGRENGWTSTIYGIIMEVED